MSSQLTIPGDVQDVSDGYHTFGELYEHRNLLLCVAMRAFGGARSWKSRRHHDGTAFEGWFIAGIDLNEGAVTYHLPDRLWDLCPARELSVGEPWDGHTSADVLQRLEAFLGRVHRGRD